MGKHYYNNGKVEKVLPENSEIPEGFVPGRLPSVGKNISKARKGYNWYNNSTDELYIKDGEEIPIGYKPGRLNITKECKSKMSKSHSKLKWFTNGIKDIILEETADIPVGYKKGRSNLGKFGTSNTDKVYYNNGVEDIRINSTDPVPDGFIKGRLANKGISTWCSGLTKETDKRVENRSKNIAKTFKNSEIGNKIYNTRKENNTLNTSKIETELETILKNIYGVENVCTQYSKDPRYPFHCDFYIKPLDLFIELNNHWTHGSHPFNPNNIKDLELLNNWKEKAKTSKFYQQAVYVWADLDVRKINKAKENKLKYLTIYKIKKGPTTIESTILEEISKICKQVE